MFWLELVGAVVVATFVIERVDECVVKRWFANEYRKAAAFWFGLSFCMLFYLSLVTTSWVLRFLIFLFFAIVVVTLVYVIIEDWVRKRWPLRPRALDPLTEKRIEIVKGLLEAQRQRGPLSEWDPDEERGKVR
jgi:ammonia channel protein AmtB